MRVENSFYTPMFINDIIEPFIPFATGSMFMDGNNPAIAYASFLVPFRVLSIATARVIIPPDYVCGLIGCRVIYIHNFFFK